MTCHRCARESGESGEPGRRIGFRDECEGCGADLHVCLACAHHDAGAYNECRESSAERVLDKDRANRCEYFTPGAGAGQGTARAELPSQARAELERLFKK